MTTMTTTLTSEAIEEARHIWEERGASRMTREDWVRLGEVLVAGKAWCAETSGYGGPKGFGKWCREQGFDGIDKATRSAIIWIIERPEELSSFRYNKYTVNIDNPHRFYQERIAELNSEDRRSQRQQVLDQVIANPGISSMEISEATGIRSNTVGARLRDLEKAGTLARDIDESDNTVGWRPRAEDEPKTQPVDKSKLATVEERLAAEAKSARVTVPELLLRRAAENLYWLNVMLARELNDGSVTTPQVSIEEQAARFGAWADEIQSVSGRTSVTTTRTDEGLQIGFKTFRAAPVTVRLIVEA